MAASVLSISMSTLPSDLLVISPMTPEDFEIYVNHHAAPNEWQLTYSIQASGVSGASRSAETVCSHQTGEQTRLIPHK